MTEWQASSGPEHLRLARLRNNFSQVRLAELAAVSERTIRLLEAGRIRQPRSGTLRSIVSAIGMGYNEQNAFLTKWRVEDAEFASGAFAIDRVGSPENYLADRVRQNQEDIDVVVCLISAEIGIDRRIRWSDVQEVFVARRDGVSGRAAVAAPGEDIDLDRLQVTHLRNFTVGRSRVLRDLRLKVFDLYFDKTLSRGETRLASYRMNYENAYVTNSVDDLLPTARIGHGFFRSVNSYAISVTFHAESLPRSMVQEYQSRPNGRVATVAEVRLDTRNTAHMSIQNVKPGGHSLRWIW